MFRLFIYLTVSTPVKFLLVGVLTTGLLAVILPASAQTSTTLVFSDGNLDGSPDEVSFALSHPYGRTECFLKENTCAWSSVFSAVNGRAIIRIRSRNKCPSRRVVKRNTDQGVQFRQQLSAANKKKCTPKSGPPKKATPKPTVGKTPVPKATATAAPVKTATPVPSGGDSAAGRSFYTQVCLSCHGVKAGATQVTVLQAMSRVPQHSSVRALVTTSVAQNIAAYLRTAR
jgi:hypothetical protein